MKWRSAMPVLLAGLLLACSEPADDDIQRQVFALGTLVEFTLVEAPENADGALREAEQALLDMEQRWRAWDDGELAALNRALREQGQASASPELRAGIRRALELAAASDNRFNPAIGALVERWGFHQEERPDGPPPGAAELAALLQPPLDPAAIGFEADQVTSADRRIWLDMGAFAKGLAVAAATRALQQAGIEQAIVNAGGDLQLLGRRGQRDWRIGVRNPDGQGVLAALELAGPVSVFTSGNYERAFRWQGERFHHILDPATGRPARGLASVTVVHPDAALADAAATALFVAGPEDWPAVARQLGVDQVLVVDSEGNISVTAALHRQLRLEGDASVKVITP